MNSELEENRELAENRLSELQKLQQDLQTVVQENNSMKVDLRSCAFSHLGAAVLSQEPIQELYIISHKNQLISDITTTGKVEHIRDDQKKQCILCWPRYVIFLVT